MKKEAKSNAYMSVYFWNLRGSVPLKADKEKELFKKVEFYSLSILCELMDIDEFWNELDRILNDMIQTAEFPTEFFDIVKARYGDFEKKTNKRLRVEMAKKIKNNLVKLKNHYKILKVMLEIGNDKKAEERLAQMNELKLSIGLTLDFLHHMRQHISQWYEQRIKNSENGRYDIIKDQELKKAAEILKRVKELSNKLKSETELIYNSNLRLSVKMAKRYHIQNTDMFDYIQDGNLAIAKAMERFEWRKGTKFSTYAVPWIKQAIIRSLNDAIHPIRMPGHIIELMNKINKFIRSFVQENGREPTISEIASKMKAPVEKIDNIMKIIKEPMSFEFFSFSPDDEAQKLDEVLDIQDSVSVIENIERNDMRKKIRRIIDIVLTPREKKVIEMRCGFYSKREATLDEVSEVLCITRERVRQIEQIATKKLKKVFSKLGYNLFDDLPINKNKSSKRTLRKCEFEKFENEGDY
ncbi:MAG: RNA polymerase sigma factor RpoD/SigA [Candidatus Calescibacterium sp.]|nr:RNA polymerase sigma factor RpoD/SigA [Candidatus Calescibacterium sp.]MCX7733785.1 RNA polymerase sigma factor RpoD/SigA [bacterium]